MQPNPFSGMDPDMMLRELRQQAEELESKSNQLRSELANASATASSPDGAVTVTLSPTGALQDISFSPKAASHKPEGLGPLVMKTVQAAQREVSNRVTASLSEQFGDPETMDFIRQYMPKPEPTRDATPRTDPHPDEGHGSVLRKRPSRGQQPSEPDRPRRRPDDGNILR